MGGTSAAENSSMRFLKNFPFSANLPDLVFACWVEPGRPELLGDELEVAGFCDRQANLVFECVEGYGILIVREAIAKNILNGRIRGSHKTVDFHRECLGGTWSQQQRHEWLKDWRIRYDDPAFFAKHTQQVEA